MKAADLAAPLVGILGLVAIGVALVASHVQAAETSPANQTPVQDLDVWQLVVCPSLPPRRGHCQRVAEVPPLPLADCQDLARGAARVLPAPAAAGCAVDPDALAAARGW